jgi:cell wall-associated NlpC family hydrolase
MFSTEASFAAMGLGEHSKSINFAYKQKTNIIIQMNILASIIIGALLFSSGTQAAEDADALHLSDSTGTSQVQAKTLPNVIQDILQYALSYEGISYRRGGASPESGFDCSGFVRHVFDHVEGVMLPHSASALSQIGNRIKMTELLPGDLVFFRIMRNTISHVGIYLGNNQFIHASSNRTGSVMVSNLNDSYWAKHFALVRRLDLPAQQSSNILEYFPSSPSLHLESELQSVSSH